MLDLSMKINYDESVWIKISPEHIATCPNCGARFVLIKIKDGEAFAIIHRLRCDKCHEPLVQYGKPLGKG